MSNMRAISSLRTVDGRQHFGLLAVQHSFGLLRLQEMFIDALLCAGSNEVTLTQNNKPQWTLPSHLHRRQRAAHDLDDLQRSKCLDAPAKPQTIHATHLRRQVRRQQRVGAAQNERVDSRRQLGRTLRAANCLQVGRAGLAAGEDGKLIPAKQLESGNRRKQCKQS